MSLKILNLLSHHLIGNTVCNLCNNFEISKSRLEYQICDTCFDKIQTKRLKNIKINTCKWCENKINSQDGICVFCKEIFEISCNAQIHAIYEYDNIIKSLIYRGKYLQDTQIINFLKKTTINYLRWEYTRNSKIDFILPIPSSDFSIKKRGFNYIHHIANFISKEFYLKLLEFSNNYLEYTYDEKKNPQIRLENFREKKYCLSTKNQDLNNKSVLILDDVLTTGNSVISALKTLEKYSVKNAYILCLSKSSNFESYFKIMRNNYILKKKLITLCLIFLTTTVSCKQVRIKSESSEQLKEEIVFLNKKIDSLQARIEILENKSNK